MLTVRHAQDDDLLAIAALLKKSGLPFQDIGTGHLADFLVAEQGGIFVGTVGLERFGESALLRSLAVHSEHRGIGLGKQLVAAIEGHASGSGVKTLYLLTMTAADFFGRHGYDVIVRAAAPEALQATPEFASLCPSQAICMSKRVG